MATKNVKGISRLRNAVDAARSVYAWCRLFALVFSAALVACGGAPMEPAAVEETPDTMAQPDAVTPPDAHPVPTAPDAGRDVLPQPQPEPQPEPDSAPAPAPDAGAVLSTSDAGPDVLPSAPAADVRTVDALPGSDAGDAAPPVVVSCGASVDERNAEINAAIADQFGIFPCTDGDGTCGTVHLWSANRTFPFLCVGGRWAYAWRDCRQLFNCPSGCQPAAFCGPIFQP